MNQGGQGEPGEPGEAGSVGGTGGQGGAGSAGPGEPGCVGDVGGAGGRGGRGGVGERGETGDKGDDGARGATGSRGSVGESGSIGESGATGSRGSVGESGSIGQRGQAGLGISLRAVVIGYLILFATLAFAIYRVEDSAATRGALIDQCERSNVVREQLHGMLLGAASARRLSAQSEIGAARSENLRLAREFDTRGAKLVEAAAPSVEPGSPLVDCEKAFP